MIILDTNVVSEPLKLNADPNVLTWLDRQVVATLFLTAISLAELRYGIAVLPNGKKKNGLKKAMEERIIPLFANRILSFDENAAKVYAHIRSNARTAGKAIAATDGYIAAIAAAHGFRIATRDVAPFKAAKVPVINPWNTGK